MVTQSYRRGCGHQEILVLDEAGPYYERKLECIARTRCAKCVKEIKQRQKKEAEERREAAHQRHMECHRRFLERRGLADSAERVDRLERACKAMRPLLQAEFDAIRKTFADFAKVNGVPMNAQYLCEQAAAISTVIGMVDGALAK